MLDSEHLPLTAEWIQILKQSRVNFCDAVKGKFGCTALIHNVPFDTASSFGSNKRTIVPEIKYSKQLSGGVKISVWKDDLTTHAVDAVVNAANEQLDHAGGLALALSHAGGPQIQQESKQIIKTKGRVSTGEAVVTSAGKLPCNNIIHAVGPWVPSNPSQTQIANASVLLEKTIRSIIRLTEFYNFQSVAVPAISSGLFNFPRDHCANIIVNTVEKISLQRVSQNRKLEVRLVNNDDPSVHEMLKACNIILGPPDSQSGAMQIQNKASSGAAGPSLQLGNVTLHLKKGSLEEETVLMMSVGQITNIIVINAQAILLNFARDAVLCQTHQVDVIVNTIGVDLDLSIGFVSKALLKKAGNRIQQEIKYTNKYVSAGDIFETRGYNLNCNAVYHTVCAQKGGVRDASQVLHRVISQCAEKAQLQKFSSISFPAIGTGNLGFKKEEVSQIMISAVVEFAKKHTGKKMDVFFVIFPKDTENFKAFEKELDSIKKKQSLSSSTAGKSSVIHGSEEIIGSTPVIELFAESSEALREAKAWAIRMLDITSGHFTINNNHVIQFGQKEHEALIDLQATFNVIITEFFRDGRCGFIINGDPVGVSSAALQLEAMLCQAQEDFAQAEENDLLHSVVRWQGFDGSEDPAINAVLEKAYLQGVDTKVIPVNGREFKVDFRRMQVENENSGRLMERISIFSTYSTLAGWNSKSYYKRALFDDRISGRKERKKHFEKCGLEIVKVEKIENYALKQVFELNEKRVPDKPQRLYQRVTAQSCEPICRVGFQREYAPPCEQKYGAGIYFTKDVKTAQKLWPSSEEEYIYIIEAQVLTGKNTIGSPHFIVAPPLPVDTQGHYNSVTDVMKDIYVIFHGQQALPEFLITCKPFSTRV